MKGIYIRLLMDRKERLGGEKWKSALSRQIAGIALVILGSIFCCFLCFGADAAVSAETEGWPDAAEQTGEGTQPVAMQITYGYDNSAKGGCYLPVNILIKNSQADDIHGTLQIKSIESDGMIYQYDFQADISAGEERCLKEYIPLGTRATQLYVKLADGMGKALAEEQLRLNVSWDVPELFVGILSDNPQELRYLDGVGIHHSSMRTRTFDLDEADFPSEERGLSLLDLLVVNNYKLRNLDEAQTSAIMDWVHSGGALILGTGERVDDTLGRFAPELLDDSYGTPGLCHIDLTENFSVKEEGMGMLAITCVDIPLHGGNVIISSDGMALFTAVSKEQGLIGVSAFDLADISQFCEQETTYVDYLLTGFLGADRITDLAEVVYNGNLAKYESVQNLINTGNVEKLPQLPLYAGLVICYLFLIGPGIYFYLKNRELLVYYRRGVLILSAVFAVMIYLIGSMTRFSNTFFAYASIMDSTDDYITETTYVNIRNPYSRPYEVSLNPDYSVFPITKNQKTGNNEWIEAIGDEEYQVEIDRSDGGLTIRGQEITAFSPKYFQLEKKSVNKDGIGLTGQVDYFEGKISGQITNHFPFALENAALVLYGNMVYLGRLEPEETKTLNGLELLRFPLNNSRILAESITGQRDFSEADIGDTQYLLAMKRTGLLMFYIDNYMTEYTADARVIAFSAKKEESTFLVDQSPETYGLTMLTSSMEVNASQNSLLYRSVLMKIPRVVTGTYDARTNSMGGMEPLTLEYQLGTDISVESLTLEPISEEFLTDSPESGGGDQALIEAFTGTIYFYNHSTGNFDKADFEENTVKMEDLSLYLSPGNILTVRYVYEGTGGHRQIQLPMPMVAGKGQ